MCVLLGPVALRPESAGFSLVDIFVLPCPGALSFSVYYARPGGMLC